MYVFIFSFFYTSTVLPQAENKHTVGTEILKRNAIGNRTLLQIFIYLKFTMEASLEIIVPARLDNLQTVKLLKK